MEFNLFLPQMRLSFDDLVARARAAEAARLRRDHRHGPPGAAAGRRPADVRGDRHDDVARRAHRAIARRLARALRRVPPPGGARASSGLDRPRLRRPLRARHRMGLGARRVRDVRCRFDRAARRVSIGSARRWRSCARCGRARSSTTTAATTSCAAHGRSRVRSARIPIVIGGIGPKTLALVREFADWWNVHVGQLAQDRRAAATGRRRARVDPADGRAHRA